uniref:Hypotheticial protein n=1 Tax=Schistosoma japonicum TaxID=6182 RepID=C1LCT4_SCHJA|nr:hypotheticial protein [Schistosoma japonicum]
MVMSMEVAMVVVAMVVVVVVDPTFMAKDMRTRMVATATEMTTMAIRMAGRMVMVREARVAMVVAAAKVVVRVVAMARVTGKEVVVRVVVAKVVTEAKEAVMHPPIIEFITHQFMPIYITPTFICVILLSFLSSYNTHHSIHLTVIS